MTASFALTDEQQMLHNSAQKWFAERLPASALRAMRNAGGTLDRGAYAEMVALGWSSILIPERFGGMGLGWRDVGLLLEAGGRTLATHPILPVALTVSAIAFGGDEAQQAEWLPRLATKEFVGTLAVDEGAHHSPQQLVTRAVEDGDSFRIEGSKMLVAEGMAADLIVVAACCGDLLELFLVPSDSEGLQRHRIATIDGRDHARIEFRSVRVPRSARLAAASGSALLAAVLDRAYAGLATEMLGLSTSAFEVTLDYMKTRVQFDRPIGSFQALQHRMSEMYTELELTRSAIEAALLAIDANSPDSTELAALAKMRAGETVHWISRQMIQLHGGIGMTDEHDAGLYLKRAQVSQTLFGNAAYHRERFGQMIGL